MRPSLCRTSFFFSFVVLSSLTVASCGPLFDSPPDPAPLNPAFNKQWIGSWSIAIQGAQPSNLNGVLSGVLTSDGRNVDLTPICFGGGPGTVRATQDGTESAHWVGTLVCASTSFGTCPSDVFTLAYVNALLLSSGVSVLVQGSVTGCGATSSFDMTFTGT